MRWGIEKAFKKLNIDYEVFDYNFSDWEKDDAFCELLDAKLENGGYELVFSVNFMPLVSMVCERRQLKYYSWVYDSPIHIFNQEPMLNGCNEIFFFDRQQAMWYASAGVNAHHLVLAADTELFDTAIRNGRDLGNASKYVSDVSLVGQLYNTDYTAYTARLDGYLRGYLEGIIMAQSKLYGAYIIPELASNDLIEAMNQCYSRIFRTVKGMENFRMGKRELEYMLACEVTKRERRQVLSLLSSQYDTVLYSSNSADGIRGLRQGGYIDYVTQMPLVFSGSRVNLNVSLKAIQSGIPLRVIDIMACGGFVLSNYQEEIAELLEPGKACAVYESVEDMYEKASFYLSHDTERMRIAVRGRELVEQEFTFEKRISEMFEI